jgi:hypothetical protein
MAYNQEIFEKVQQYHSHCKVLDSHINSSPNTFLTPNGETLVLFDPHDEVHMTNFNMYDEIMLSLDDDDEILDLYMDLCDAIEDERYEDALAIKTSLQDF